MIIPVIPAQAGIQTTDNLLMVIVDSRLRGNDKKH